MPGTNIGWSEAAPANGDNAGLGAQEIRSLKTAIRTGLAAEHVWPSSSGAAGAHAIGSARAHYAVESKVSSSDTDGRLMVSSDKSRFFHVGSSTGTMFLGSVYGLNIATLGGGAESLPVLPQTHYWVADTAFGTLGSLGTQIVTFGGSGYSGIPFLFAQYAGAAPTQLIGIHASTLDKTTCTLWGFTSSGSAANASYRLLSIGSRVLG